LKYSLKQGGSSLCDHW